MSTQSLIPYNITTAETRKTASGKQRVSGKNNITAHTDTECTVKTNLPLIAALENSTSLISTTLQDHVQVRNSGSNG